MNRLLIAVVFASVLAPGQTTINGGRTVTGAWDASGAAATKAVKSGTSLPATCAVGEYYDKTDEAAGLTLHTCTATNTWKRAAYSQGTSAPAACSVGQVFFDTDATAGSNLTLCTATDTWTAVTGTGGGSVYLVAGYGNTTGLSSGGTSRHYTPLGEVQMAASTESNSQIALPKAGTLTNFYLRFQSPTNATYGTSGCTVRKNGADTTLSLFWAGDGTIKAGTDTDTVSVAQYDRIAVSCVNNADAGTATPLQTVLELQ